LSGFSSLCRDAGIECTFKPAAAQGQGSARSGFRQRFGERLVIMAAEDVAWARDRFRGLLLREIPVADTGEQGMIETRKIKLLEWRGWRVADPQAKGPSRDVFRRDR